MLTSNLGFAFPLLALTFFADYVKEKAWVDSYMVHSEGFRWSQRVIKHHISYKYPGLTQGQFPNNPGFQRNPGGFQGPGGPPYSPPNSFRNNNPAALNQNQIHIQGPGGPLIPFGNNNRPSSALNQFQNGRSPGQNSEFRGPHPGALPQGQNPDENSVFPSKNFKFQGPVGQSFGKEDPEVPPSPTQDQDENENPRKNSESPIPEEGPGSIIKSPSSSNHLKDNPDDVKSSESIISEQEDELEVIDSGPNLFTVTNTDVGFTWEALPFREKYQWDSLNAPCHSFTLKVPDEKADKSGIELCIYRPRLEFEDDTELFIYHVEGEINQDQKDLKVYGYVKGTNGSAVYGKIVDTYFYGEVSIPDLETGTDIIYVVEEIKILSKLMRHNEKVLRNILFVMNNGAPPTVKYNAVVTKGASLMNFMVSINPTEFIRGSFLVFSTSQISYITSGEPQMDVDDTGKISFNAGGDKIEIDTIGTVHLFTHNKEFIFRPHGKTMVHEGNQLETLQRHEGSVAISAFTSDSSYGCILPTPATQHGRKGGFLCKVCLAADKLFKLHYMYQLNSISGETTVSFVGRIIDRVSWMFRSVDWNDDTHPDNVGLDYDPQVEPWNYHDSGSENLTKEELKVLFGSLSALDFNDCCLGIAYTMKNLPGSTLAMTSGEKDSSTGGVCGIRTDGKYNNLILISANNKQGDYSPMTEEQLTYLTAHEIAKAFGSGLDGSGKVECDEFNDKGSTRHFIMWPDVLRNLTPTEKTFSTCSKKSIASVSLSTCKSACFDVDKHPFCGNGIVEDGEECDCGSESDCSQQKCCYARNGKHPCRKTGISCKHTKAISAAYETFKSSSTLIILALSIPILKTHF